MSDQDLAKEDEYFVLEGLTRTGMFGINRYSGHLSVNSIVNGEASIDLHYKIISKLCQLILVKTAAEK